MDSGKEPRDEFFLEALKKKYQVYIESPDNCQGEIDIFLVLNKNDKSTPNYSNYNTNYINSLSKNIDSERLIKYIQSPNEITNNVSNSINLNKSTQDQGYVNNSKSENIFDGINGIRNVNNKNQTNIQSNNNLFNNSNLNISNFSNPYSFSNPNNMNINLNLPNNVCIPNQYIGNPYYNNINEQIPKNINLFDYADMNAMNNSTNINKLIKKESNLNDNNVSKMVKK